MKEKKMVVHEPYNRFKGFALEKGITYADIAEVIGVTPTTVSLKINGHSDFYLSEYKLLQQKYNVSEEIFL